MEKTIASPATLAVPPPAFESTLRALEASALRNDPHAAIALFSDAHLQASKRVAADKVELLASALAWSGAQAAQANWIHDTQQRLAVVSRRICVSLGTTPGTQPAALRGALGLALFYAGEVIKAEILAGTRKTRDCGPMNALMRTAIAEGQHGEPVFLDVYGRRVGCTVESLHFRALLLARFASGILNSRQIEILDAWMWMWLPKLKGSATAPNSSALKVDLDSNLGLTRQIGGDPGNYRFLAAAPIEEAYAAIVRDLHSGRMVPADDWTSRFRIEEHVAVLDLIRTSLGESARAPVARAERRSSQAQAEAYLGLSEIMVRGFAPVPAAPSSTSGAQALRLVDEDDLPVGPASDSHAFARRMVSVVDVSDNGIGLEGAQSDCGNIAVGDLIAIRLEAQDPLVLGKVVRSLPAATPGRVFIGVRVLSATAHPMRLEQPHAPNPVDRQLDLLFVPGEDDSGRHDACLVSERTFDQAAALESHCGETIYTLRFNRSRERGRGWVMAGFEVVGSRPARAAA